MYRDKQSFYGAGIFDFGNTINQVNLFGMQATCVTVSAMPQPFQHLPKIQLQRFRTVLAEFIVQVQQPEMPKQKRNPHSLVFCSECGTLLDPPDGASETVVCNTCGGSVGSDGTPRQPSVSPHCESRSIRICLHDSIRIH